MDKTFAFTASGLTVGYGGRPLIREIEIALRPGEICALIGPNGAGKSTILRSITRHLAPIAGTVLIGGEDVRAMSYGDLAKRLSVVLTERLRPEMMTCYDVVATGRYPYTNRFGALTPHDRAMIDRSLERVRALDLADRDFTRISDGQRQRVLLARALCQEPEIIVLDEPTSFLDIRHKIELLDILLEMSREKGITVILSLHEIDLAAKVADIVLCVKGETIACAGRPEEVFTAEQIASLYDLTRGSYNVLFGSVELEKPEGEPQAFVLCGAGCGAPVFRAMQKKRVPFCAGILFDNDVDYAVAQPLAARVFAQRAFTRIEPALFEGAWEAMRACGRVIDTGAPVGEANRENALLLARAREAGIEIVKGWP